MVLINKMSIESFNEYGCLKKFNNLSIKITELIFD